MTIAPSVFIHTDWYWVVGDHNPTTEVYSSSSAGYVANNAAAFLTWLSAATNWGTYRAITNAVDDGTGKVRLTVETSSGMSSGQTWNIFEVGGTTEANGNQTITVINSTTIDLDSVNFVHAYTSGGFIKGPSLIDTNANMLAQVDHIARTSFRDTYASYSTAANITLTNPMPTLVDITASGTISITLPVMNTVSSLPVGWPFEIRNLTGSTSNVTVKDSAGGTIGTALEPGEVLRNSVCTSNATAAGAFSGSILDKIAASGSGADLSTNSVGNTQIRQSSGLSLIGRSANSTGNVADITSNADGKVMRQASSAIGFGSIDLTDTDTVTATAWTATTPTPTSTGGAFTTASSNLHTQVVGKTAAIAGNITLTTIGGSASGSLLLTLTVTSNVSMSISCINAATLAPAAAYINASTTTLTINPTRAFTAGDVYYFSAVIETT